MAIVEQNDHSEVKQEIQELFGELSDSYNYDAEVVRRAALLNS